MNKVRAKKAAELAHSEMRSDSQETHRMGKYWASVDVCGMPKVQPVKPGCLSAAKVSALVQCAAKRPTVHSEPGDASRLWS